MKIKLLSFFMAATVVSTTVSNAAVISVAGIANSTNNIGLITLDPTETPSVALRSTVSGRAIFVSVTDALVGVASSMDTLLASTSTLPAAFDTALATLIGSTSSTDPGVVRNATFTNGVLASTGTVQLGDVGNKTYLFLVSESGGVITGIGAYTGSNAPASGAVTFNAAGSGDSLGIGTSVFAAATTSPTQPASGFQLKSAVAAIPEPSAALLGAIGALVLLRRRRI